MIRCRPSTKAGRRFRRTAGVCSLAVLMVLAIVPVLARAQNSRERLTQRLHELRVDYERARSDAERHEAFDRLEAVRHELGTRDASDRPVEWEVSTQRVVTERLAAEIEKLATDTPVDRTKRAWRVCARDLLRRVDAESDRWQQYRWAVGGLALANNASVFDALAEALPRVEQRRTEVGDDANLRGRLDAALNAARELGKLAGRVESGGKRIDWGELRHLRRLFARIDRGVRALETEPAAAPSSESDTPAGVEPRLAALAEAAKVLAENRPQIAEHVEGYLSRIRFGLDHPQARPLALEMLANIKKAVGLATEIRASTVLSDTERAARLDQLEGALAGIGDVDRRAAAYRTIRQMDNLARERRRFEELGTSDDARRDLWAGLRRAEEEARDNSDESRRREAENIRNAFGSLQGNWHRLYTDPAPQIRTLAMPFERGVKRFEQRMEDLSLMLRRRHAQAGNMAWQINGFVGELHLMARVSRLIERIEARQPVPSSLKVAAGQAAVALIDDDGRNDGQGRRILNELERCFGLWLDFARAEVAREDRAEAARVSRNRHYQLYNRQAERMPTMVKRAIENDLELRTSLELTLPAYRAVAEWLLLSRAADDGSLGDVAAADDLTFDPDGLMALARDVADRLGPIYIEMPRADTQDMAALVAPIRTRESALATPVGALLELRRTDDLADRLTRIGRLLDHAADGPNNHDKRRRWEACWHANQAMTAYAGGYQRTGDVHGEWLRRWSVMNDVPLTRIEEPDE